MKRVGFQRKFCVRSSNKVWAFLPLLCVNFVFSSSAQAVSTATSINCGPAPAVKVEEVFEFFKSEASKWPGCEKLVPSIESLVQELKKSEVLNRQDPEALSLGGAEAPNSPNSNENELTALFGQADSQSEKSQGQFSVIRNGGDRLKIISNNLILTKTRELQGLVAKFLELKGNLADIPIHGVEAPRELKDCHLTTSVSEEEMKEAMRELTGLDVLNLHKKIKKRLRPHLKEILRQYNECLSVNPSRLTTPASQACSASDPVESSELSNASSRLTKEKELLSKIQILTSDLEKLGVQSLSKDFAGAIGRLGQDAYSQHRMTLEDRRLLASFSKESLVDDSEKESASTWKKLTSWVLKKLERAKILWARSPKSQNSLDERMKFLLSELKLPSSVSSAFMTDREDNNGAVGRSISAMKNELDGIEKNTALGTLADTDVVQEMNAIKRAKILFDFLPVAYSFYSAKKLFERQCQAEVEISGAQVVGKDDFKKFESQIKEWCSGKRAVTTASMMPKLNSIGGRIAAGVTGGGAAVSAVSTVSTVSIDTGDTGDTRSVEMTTVEANVETPWGPIKVNVPVPKNSIASVPSLPSAHSVGTPVNSLGSASQPGVVQGTASLNGTGAGSKSGREILAEDTDHFSENLKGEGSGDPSAYDSSVWDGDGQIKSAAESITAQAEESTRNILRGMLGQGLVGLDFNLQASLQASKILDQLQKQNPIAYNEILKKLKDQKASELNAKAEQSAKEIQERAKQLATEMAQKELTSAIAQAKIKARSEFESEHNQAIERIKKEKEDAIASLRAQESTSLDKIRRQELDSLEQIRAEARRQLEKIKAKASGGDSSAGQQISSAEGSSEDASSSGNLNDGIFNGRLQEKYEHIETEVMNAKEEALKKIQDEVRMTLESAKRESPENLDLFASRVSAEKQAAEKRIDVVFDVRKAKAREELSPSARPEVMEREELRAKKAYENELQIRKSAQKKYILELIKRFIGKLRRDGKISATNQPGEAPVLKLDRGRRSVNVKPGDSSVVFRGDWNDDQVADFLKDRMGTPESFSKKSQIVFRDLKFKKDHEQLFWFVGFEKRRYTALHAAWIAE